MNWKSKSKKETVGADTASSVSEGRKVKKEQKNNLSPPLTRRPDSFQANFRQISCSSVSLLPSVRPRSVQKVLTCVLSSGALIGLDTFSMGVVKLKADEVSSHKALLYIGK